MRGTILTIALAVAAGDALAAAPATPAQTLANQVCALCHGSGGRSISPTFPRLAGQPAPYIETQLHAFRDQTRQDPDAQAYMWGMSAQLDDSIIRELARFYSSQTPQPTKAADAKLSTAGEAIFRQGIPAAGVPACASCHGSDGQGMQQFPRLAGQHVAYQVKQLQAFRSGLRASPIMQPIAARLDDAQMRAVANYIGAR